MYVKTATIILTFFIVTAQGEKLWTTLLGKWVTSTDEGWYDLPQNISAAESEGWTEVEGAWDSESIIGMCYYDDPRVTLLYDACTGHVNGFRFGIPVADIEDEGVTMNYTSVPHITETTINGENYYTSTLYFNEDEESDTREIQSVRNDGTLEDIPTKTAELTSETTYEYKLCLPKMGHHYYKMNRSTTAAEWSPWALITHDEENIVSVVYTNVGVMSVANNRNWTENFARNMLTYYIPTTPQWLVDLLGEFGFISFHLFLADPRGYNCTDLS